MAIASQTNRVPLWRKPVLSSLIVIFLLCLFIGTARTGDIFAPPGTSEDNAVPDVVIDVYGEGLLKTNLAVPSFAPLAGVNDGGSLGRDGAMIVGRDLQFSSFFNVLSAPELPAVPPGGYDESKLDFEPYSKIGAELLVAGTYSLAPDGTYTFDLKLFDVVQKAMLTRATYRGKRDMFRRLMHRFSDEVLRSETGTPGPFESRIAFAADWKGRQEIFYCDTDGQNMMRLTQTESINMSPAWSPDASQIVYTSYFTGNPDLYILPIVGGKPRRLFGGKGLNYGADWCKANNRIVFASSNNQEGDQEIYTIRPDGTDLLQVTHEPWSIEVSPSWSPDGKYIAFVSSRYGDKPQVLITPGEGGTSFRVSRTGGYNTDPSWSPVGDFIAYCGRTGGGLDILAVKLGKSLEVIQTVAVTSQSGSDETPSVSPDGRFVVYSHGSQNNYDIYMTSMREQKPRKITSLPGKESAPAWSSRLSQK